MLIVFIDILRVIRNGLHPSRTHSTRPDLSGLAQGGRNGIWDVNSRKILILLRHWKAWLRSAAEAAMFSLLVSRDSSLAS
jgi:hypothetical protein